MSIIAPIAILLALSAGFFVLAVQTSREGRPKRPRHDLNDGMASREIDGTTVILRTPKGN